MKRRPSGRLFCYPPAGLTALSGVFAVAEPDGVDAGGADAAGATTVVPLKACGGTIARRVEPPAARIAAARLAGAERARAGEGASAA